MRKYILHIKYYILQKRGYTVAELLAVMSILVIISTVVVGIIYSTIRGSAKTRATTDVSQNGEYATTVISGIISDSRNILEINGVKFDDCTNSPSTTAIVPTPPGFSPSIKLKRIDGGITVLSCQNVIVNNVSPTPPSSAYTIASDGTTLVNLRAVKVSACSFSCSQEVSDPYSIPIVSFSFSLAQAGSTLFENTASSTFKSSASLRVYSP